MRRVDGPDKVVGKVRYVADEVRAGTVHAVLLQSDIAFGCVTSIEAAEALALPGVLRLFCPVDCQSIRELAPELTANLPGERRPPLADWQVHYAGQHIGLLVAETLEIAQQAAALVRVTYDERTPQLDPSAVTSRPLDVQEQWVRAGTYQPDHFTKMVEEKLQYRRGHEPATHEVDANISAVYTTPVEHHNPIETSATLAYWVEDEVTLHDTTRWLLGSRMTIASSLGVPESKVHILCPYLGGAFGSKGFLWQHSVLAAFASRELGRPVKLVVTRPQMFTSVGHRPLTIQRISLKAAGDHHILSTEHHTLSETSTLGDFVEPAGLSSKSLYSSAHVEVSHTVARLHRATPVFMRAPGEAPGLFALESAIDELAYAFKPPIDPLALRLQNYAERDVDQRKPYASKRLWDCYDTAQQRFGWAHRPVEPRSIRKQGRLVGQGMATASYPGRRMQASARASLSVNGRLLIQVATHEIGNGVRTMLTQVAADASGMLATDIQVETGSSDFPEAPYTGASQTTASVGPAVQQAAVAVVRQLKELAAATALSPLFGQNPDDITICQGALSAGGHALPIAVMMHEHGRELSASCTAHLPEAMERESHQSFGVHFVEVEIDEDIGQILVTRWVGAFDAGHILNPMLARSQIMGGIVFGIGMALLEETHYASNGKPINSNLAEYLLPTNADVPEMEIILLDHPDLSLNPLGTRGIGELGIAGAAAAIANAVFHATGKRLRHLPLKL